MQQQQQAGASGAWTDYLALDQRVRYERRIAVEAFLAYLQRCEAGGRFTRIGRGVEPDEVCLMAARAVDEILAAPAWLALAREFNTIARRAGQWAWLAGAGRTDEGE